MGNATSAGLGSEASHDERDIRHGGQYSDNGPIDIELAEEAKESEVPRPPASYNNAPDTLRPMCENLVSRSNSANFENLCSTSMLENKNRTKQKKMKSTRNGKRAHACELNL